MRDVPSDFCQMVEKTLKFVEKTTDDIDYLLTNNKLFLNRTKGVGIITKREAIEYGVCGPVLRASGIQHDIRRARPYLGYERFDFQVALEHEGDVYARYRVRLFEIRQSIKIIRQALKELPSGPVNVDDPRIVIPPKPEVYNSAEGLIYHFKCYMVGDGHGICPPKGEIYSVTEAPNGELGFYIISDGTQKPYRMRVKGPSFYNYQIFPKLCKQGMLADIVANLSSLNIIVGELDR
jgi:NADH-quinone oxidoreductase subunit D